MKQALFYLLTFLFMHAFSQADSLSIYGIVIDDKGEAIPFVNVTLLQNGNQIIGTTTDFYGKYSFRSLSHGEYSLHVSMMCYEHTLERKVMISQKPVAKNIIIDQKSFREKGLINLNTDSLIKNR